MAAVATGAGSTSAPRWLVATLVGSLALNLVVVGAIASSLWRQHSESARGAPLTGFAPRHELGYLVTLPPGRVEELERLTEQEWRKVRPLRRVLLKARDEAVTALVADPFDRQRYLEAQSKLVAADLTAREAALRLRGEIALHLTPEERRRFQRWREQQRPPQNPLDGPDKQTGEAPR